MKQETIIHLFITNACRHNCPLCCNKLYNIDEIPVVTVELLKKATTVCLTGGEPFSINPMILGPFIRNLRNQYKNIENLYIYTSGYDLMIAKLMLPSLIKEGYIDGINVAPKDNENWNSFYSALLTHPDIFRGKSNRLYVFDEQRSKFDNLSISFKDVNIEVLGRKWQQTFNTPDNEHFVRLPILF